MIHQAIAVVAVFVATTSEVVSSTTGSAVLCCAPDGVCFPVETIQACVDALLPAIEEEQNVAGVGAPETIEMAAAIDMLMPPRLDPAARLLLVEDCGEPYRPQGYTYDVLDCSVVDIVDQCAPTSGDGLPFVVHWSVSKTWSNTSLFVDAQIGGVFWAFVDVAGWTRRSEAAVEEGGCFR